MSAPARAAAREINMGQLERGLRCVLDVDRRGGRLFQRDNDTIVLMDCNSLTSGQIERLQTAYPQLQVTVLQSDASASGFLILFQLASPAFRKSAAQLVFHLAVFACGLYALALAHARQQTP